MNLHIPKRTLQIARSLAIIGGTGAILVGATLAQTQVGTATLTGNTFSAAMGGIEIANDSSGTPGTFGTTATGFDFGTLSEGGAASTHENFWLKDNTSGAISVTVSAPTNVTLNNINAADVMVNFEKAGTTTPDTISLADLQSSSLTLSQPPAAADTSGDEYSVWITLSTGAISSGTTATASFDLTFTGSSSS